MTLLDTLKALLLASAALQEEPRVPAQLLRDVIERLRGLETEISVAHDLLHAAERVICELIPLATHGQPTN